VADLSAAAGDGDFLLRNTWGTRIGLAAPAWLIEIGTRLMRTESELVLKSRRVVPGRLLAAGFQFEFPEWPAAARDLVARWRSHTFPTLVNRRSSIPV
jgi:hypothetical protein